MRIQDADLDRLNPPQRAAVTHGEGPLLILAGAGSGKTRVITHRIAHLVASQFADPREIVAVTFTNKAAQEMKSRIEALLGFGIGGAYVGTFHSFGLRLLRQHAVEAGYPANFVIYDSADQLSLVKEALAKRQVDDKAFPPRAVLSQISKWKNALSDPEQAAEHARFPDQKLYAQIYRDYEEALKRSCAMDFDDLLVQSIRMLKRRPEVALRLAERVRWLLVDEYQDTNPLQYALIRLLTQKHKNLCCVGDEDQSIYAFRGADIRNILDFERDFPDAKVVKLEQNYRSTPLILQAASTLIRNNQNRHDKTLWTERTGGERIKVRICQDDRSEADYVVAEIKRTTATLGIPLDDAAVLYRTNASSRLIEDRLTGAGIGYRIYGSVRFYDRKEIKDLVAWLRLLVQPDSDQDFLRAASTPPRGLGATSLEELSRRAGEEQSSLWRAAQSVLARPGSISSRAVRALGQMHEMVKRLTEMTERGAAAEALQLVIDELHYLEHLEKAHPQDHVDRVENLDALVSAAKEFDEAGGQGLGPFLDRITLRSDTDDEKGAGGPTLMTVHAAKGLEFPLVFIIGLNQELFPHAMSRGADELEEERRLMYVAITRAERALVLTASRFRHHYGRSQFSEPSIFLEEIPASICDVTQESSWGSADRPQRAWRQQSWADEREDHQPRSSTPPAGVRPNSASSSVERRVERDEESVQYRIGTRVVHPSFGAGVVLAARGEGDRLTLDIRFERAGRKTIVPRFAHLEIG